jgi:hypothetical protein
LSFQSGRRVTLKPGDGMTKALWQPCFKILDLPPTGIAARQSRHPDKANEAPSVVNGGGFSFFNKSCIAGINTNFLY